MLHALADWRRSPLFDSEYPLALDHAEAMTLNRVDEDLRARIKWRWMFRRRDFRSLPEQAPSGTS